MNKAIFISPPPHPPPPSPLEMLQKAEAPPTLTLLLQSCLPAGLQTAEGGAALEEAGCCISAARATPLSLWRSPGGFQAVGVATL